MMKDSSPVRCLITFSFELIKVGGVNSFGRIPFLLFADLLEGQTIANAEKLWDLVEHSVDNLTDPESFKRGEKFGSHVFLVFVMFLEKLLQFSYSSHLGNV